MSRRTNALAEDLSPEDFLRVADARRDIWTAGFKGIAVGAAGGGSIALLARSTGIIPARKFKPLLQGLILAGTCFGSLVNSMATARSKMTQLGEEGVFAANATPDLSDYQRKIERARRLEAQVPGGTMEPPPVEPAKDASQAGPPGRPYPRRPLPSLDPSHPALQRKPGTPPPQWTPEDPRVDDYIRKHHHRVNGRFGFIPRDTGEEHPY